jgi:EF hand
MRLGGPGGPPDPSRFMAMPFLRDGDRDQSGDLSPEEFTKLGDSWFAKWDKAGSGTATSEQIGEGLDQVFRPPGGGMGPGMPGGGQQRLRTNSIPAGPMMFRGPGAFLGPALLKLGDKDADERLSGAETKAMFGSWSTQWDANHDGKLSPEEIGGGVRGFFPGPFGAPPGGGPRADTAPRQPGTE